MRSQVTSTPVVSSSTVVAIKWLCDAAFDRALASGEPVHPARFLRGRELYTRLGDRRGAVGQAGSHLMTLATLGAFDEVLDTNRRGAWLRLLEETR